MNLKFNPQKKSTRAVLWLTATIIFPLILAIGYITVTKNCYNAMNDIPMTVFASSENERGETVLVVLNKEYVLK